MKEAEASTAATPDPIDARVEALRRITESHRGTTVAPSSTPKTSFEWQPPEIPKLSPPPAMPQNAGPLDGLEWDRSLARGSDAQADTTPKPRGMTAAQTSAFALGGLALIAAVMFHQQLSPAAKRVGRSIVQTIRQRAALVACLGAALVLADRFVFDGFEFDHYFTGLHNAGWIALFGGLVALIGIYHWIAGPPDPKI